MNWYDELSQRDTSKSSIRLPLPSAVCFLLLLFFFFFWFSTVAASAICCSLPMKLSMSSKQWLRIPWREAEQFHSAVFDWKAAKGELKVMRGRTTSLSARRKERSDPLLSPFAVLKRSSAIFMLLSPTFGNSALVFTPASRPHPLLHKHKCTEPLCALEKEFLVSYLWARGKVEGWPEGGLEHAGRVGWVSRTIRASPLRSEQACRRSRGFQQLKVKGENGPLVYGWSLSGCHQKRPSAGTQEVRHTRLNFKTTENSSNWCFNRDTFGENADLWSVWHSALNLA